MYISVVISLILVAFVITFTLVVSVIKKQKKLYMVPRNISDAEHLVQFFAHAAYNKQKGRKRFFRVPLRKSGKHSIISKLPNIAVLEDVTDTPEKNHVEIAEALTKPSPYQWREIQSFARKTMAPLLITARESHTEVVVCLNVQDALPHFEFFRIAISKCSRHVDNVSIIVYNSVARDETDQATEQMLACALVKYLYEFKCQVLTGTTKSNFNLIRNAVNVVVLPHDAFGLMASVSGYNDRVVKLASSRDNNTAWPTNFLLLRDFPLIDRNTCRNKEKWINRLTAGLRSPLLPKELTLFEKIAIQMGKDVETEILKLHSSAPE